MHRTACLRGSGTSGAGLMGRLEACGAHPWRVRSSGFGGTARIAPPGAMCGGQVISDIALGGTAPRIGHRVPGPGWPEPAEADDAAACYHSSA